MIFSSH